MCTLSAPNLPGGRDFEIWEALALWRLVDVDVDVGKKIMWWGLSYLPSPP